MEYNCLTLVSILCCIIFFGIVIVLFLANIYSAIKDIRSRSRHIMQTQEDIYKAIRIAQIQKGETDPDVLIRRFERNQTWTLDMIVKEDMGLYKKK